MNEFAIYCLLLAIWNVILFYGKDFGISVLLFIVPLLIYFYFLFKKNNLIKNKKGLLFMIPIVILSMTFFIFNSNTFNVLNPLVIIGLILLMYIFTVKPIYNVKNIIIDMFRLLFKPWCFIGKFYRKCTSNIKLNMSDKTKKILKALLIVLPIVIVVLILLSNADMIFDKLFSSIFSRIKDWFTLEIFDSLLGKLFVGIIVLFAIGSTSLYIINAYHKEEDKKKEKRFKDIYTIKLLVTILNIIYVIFDFIQIKSLMLHNVTYGINFAEYARQGFFELMFVSFINLAVILASKKFDINNKKDKKYINIMSVVMVVLTLIIIASSFMRMHLYETAYGYTVLRLLVYVTLITEALLMIPTVMYIFNSKFNIVKSYMIIMISVYCIINYINIDYLIAYKNVNKYYTDNKIDLNYLANYESDNIPILIDLYKNTKNEEMRSALFDYFIDVMENNKRSSIFEYNISKSRCIRMIKELDK
ncbi:MAG: DUF4173 domain-containing protein [Bacilli bacterium]|nr:DUF4173 domain-containing protein [Bacilli bacterium]